jgi:DNA-binding transcriptional regulator YiaG
MPNIASILKEEIVRLARKEVRLEVESLKKASTQHRSTLADLKRRVATLEKQLSQAGKRPSTKAASEGENESATRVRFSAKGLASQRQRLELSASDMGTLLEVSAQTIYNWETGKSKPRQRQLAAIAALRKMGKRQAQAQLANLNA